MMILKQLSLAALGCCLLACGNSPDSGRANSVAIAPPASGESRAGESYRVQISGHDGQDLVFQVFEPQQFNGDSSYPMVLHSHGFGNARATEYSDEGVQNVGNIKLLTENDYGVVSIDMRAHGESAGQIRVHDPDAEIQDVILIVDWIEANLPWVTRRFDAQAGETNIVLGSVGASYGGQYQLLLNAVDPKRRLDAMVPSNTWYDLARALNTNDVLKSGWINLLFAGGNNAGDRTDNFDPYVTQLLLASELNNRMPDDGIEFLRYHSNAYFCEGEAVSSNGGPGTRALQAPDAPPAIPALFTQGLRDTLFNFNDALDNYRCLRDVGAADVRLLTYQSGHNTIFPGPGVAFQPSQPVSTDRNCASLTYDQAMLAFLDEHLKLQAGRVDAVMGDPDDICLSLTVADGIIVQRDNLGGASTAFDLGNTTVTNLNTTGLPAVAEGSLFTANSEGLVLAGIPRAQISLSTTSGLGTDPILMVGIGHRRASGNGQGIWDVVDNAVTPIRGNGDFSFDLAGIAEGLSPGDEVAILLFSSYLTHQLSGTRDPLSFSMTVSGSVQVPILSNADYELAN